jgi:hypothetical protein
MDLLLWLLLSPGLPSADEGSRRPLYTPGSASNEDAEVARPACPPPRPESAEERERRG